MGQPLTDALGSYLNEIRRYPLLTAEQERVLLTAAKQGDRRATEKLIKHNLRLVVFVARRYQRIAGTLEFSDLIQEGATGLKVAIDKFDLSRGKLSTYAVRCIRQRIVRAISNDSRTVRVPVHRYKDQWRIKKTTQMLSQQFGRQPTLKELAAALEETCDWVLNRLQIFRFISSLDQPLQNHTHKSEGEASTLGELISAEGDQWEEVIKSERREQLDLLLTRIPPKHAAVMRLRYGLDQGEARSLEAVGALLHLSKERIRQIERKALRSLQSKALTTDTRVITIPDTTMTRTRENEEKALRAVADAEAAAIANGSYKLPSRNELGVRIGLDNYFYGDTFGSKKAKEAYFAAQDRLHQKARQQSAVNSPQNPPTLFSVTTTQPLPDPYRHLEQDNARLRAEIETLKQQLQQAPTNNENALLQALKDEYQQLTRDAAGLADRIAELEQTRQQLLSNAQVIQRLIEQRETTVKAETATIAAQNGHRALTGAIG